MAKDEERILGRKKKDAPRFTSKDFLSTGIDLFDLACADRIGGALLKGGYYLYVGTSDSGKSVITRLALAEAVNSPNFKDYRIIEDNKERGALMDLSKFYGQRFVDKLETPGKNGSHSTNIEDFYYNLDDAVKDGRPFVYLLDSMDSLGSKDQDAKHEQRKSHARGTRKQEVAGEYGDGKAKYNSQYLRKYAAKMAEMHSILIIISQVRDNIGREFWEPEEVVSGGKALKYYAKLQMWTKEKRLIRKEATINKNKIMRAVGKTIQIDVKKNHISGKDRSITVDIYPEFGVDNLGTTVNFLVESGYWPKDKQGVIDAHDLKVQAYREKLIRHIEDSDLEDDVRMVLKTVWGEIEDKVAVTRKPRYE